MPFDFLRFLARRLESIDDLQHGFGEDVGRNVPPVVKLKRE
jgi:hypothetical protein